MNEKIIALSEEIEDVETQIEERRIRGEFNRIDRLEYRLKVAKDNLAAAVKEARNEKERRV